MTDTTVTTLRSDALTAEIADLGAELQSLTFAGRPLLWTGDAAWWAGRSPILFPIVGRAPGDTVAAGGVTAEMKQHGFARRSGWDRVAATAAAVTHRLAASDATRAVYPFDFRLTLTHALAGATLAVTAEVTNDGAAEMPFGLGFHPAFLWPLPGATGPHEVVLANGAEPALHRLDDGLFVPAPLPSPFRRGRYVPEARDFDADAMVFPADAGDALRYTAPGAPRLSFRFDNLPNLALWQKPGAPFLCIEPWHGTAATVGAGPEIAARPFTTRLAPGATARFGWSLTVTDS
ncbi:aldose 1-epimerase family protein [Frigidibacter sp. MR17.24]|uniref:aldose 1-epimerase family protein n=1 Tax=Frigidibacter sp. MR17.24 TaxID=3127345 RepID=UPI003012C245